MPRTSFLNLARLSSSTGEFVCDRRSRLEELTEPQEWQWGDREEEMVVACPVCRCQWQRILLPDKLLPVSSLSSSSILFLRKMFSYPC
jgi:hypothetical protein